MSRLGPQYQTLTIRGRLPVYLANPAALQLDGLLSVEATMPNKVICHYRVARGNEKKFEALLKKHWPTLHQLGLVTDDPPQHFKGEEQDNGKPIYFEMFDWRDGAGDRAHEHPEVMAIWGPMDQLCEKRGDKPNMEFPHVDVLGA